MSHTSHRPHVLDDLVLLDADGQRVRLGGLWADRTAVLLFVRHFGCLFCRQQIAEMLPVLDRIRAAGAELFVIGNGTVEEARVFHAEQRLPVRLLTDPAREAYCAVGMQRGTGTVLTAGVLKRGVSAFLRGFRQTRVAGDPLQQGGVVVITRGGRERYRYVSATAGDHPSPDAVLHSIEAP